MKNQIFQLKSNPEIGFSIQEDYENKYDPKTQQLKKTKSKVCQLWIDEYEGGDFEIGSGGEFKKLSKKKGSGILFPSFLMHRVTPITKGVRKSLVLWVGGESYK